MTGQPEAGAIAALRDRLDRGVTTAVDEVSRVQTQPDRLGCIEAYVPRATELAAASDARRRAGALLGPLDGIPFAVKANIDVAGVPTTSGLVGSGAPIAEQDAVVVAGLVAAGAIPTAIATMAPLAIGAVTRHPTIGPCRSPLDRDRHAGGSSGGSGAAVGAGIVPFALGSDTMGSVRIPAAYCGVAAWLPTHDALSATGLTPLQSDLDNVGVIAATSADLVEIAAVLLAQGTPTVPPVDAFSRVRQCDLTPRADAAGRAACDVVTDALLRTGLDRGPDLMTDIDPAVLRRHGLILVEVQAAQTFAAQLAAGVIPDDIAALLRYGQDVTPERITAAHTALRDFAAHITADLRPGDVVVLPTTPAGAPLVTDDPAGAADLTAWINAAGLPAVAVPVADRSVQLVASSGDDLRLLALAAHLADQVPNAGGLRSRNADTPS